MIRAAAQRALLAGVVAVFSLIPLTVGLLGIVLGARAFGEIDPSPDLDSHVRYLSGVFLGVGLGFLSCAPRIERMGPRFRLLALAVVIGGVARALSLAEDGPPSIGHRLGLVMELVVVPLLVAWQARVARARGTP